MLFFSVLYNLVLIFFGIVLIPVILIALAVVLKFYNFKIDKTKQTIFFHAVSVGEVNAIETLVKRTRKEFPEANIVLSTTTKTGQQIAEKKLSNTVDVITYFPFDYFFSVNSFLNAACPDKIIIAETEIWPDFVYLAKRRNIPVYIVNGRLSPNSYKGYKRFSFFFKPVLSQYEGIFMQTQGDKERILDVGAPAEKTKVMGNLKFDIAPVLNDSEISELAESLKLNCKKMIAAASTH